MYHEPTLLMNLPSDSPEEDAIARIAAALDAPVIDELGSSPRVSADGLLVYGVIPDDEDKAVVERLFELDSNLTLVLVNLVRDDTDRAIRVEQTIMRVVLILAAVEGTRAVLVEDMSASAIILKFEAGHVVLNQDWDGWELWPEVLDVIPSPRRMESLQGSD